MGDLLKTWEGKVESDGEEGLKVWMGEAQTDCKFTALGTNGTAAAERVKVEKSDKA